MGRGEMRSGGEGRDGITGRGGEGRGGGEFQELVNILQLLCTSTCAIIAFQAGT
jgi:hypothetical protein